LKPHIFINVICPFVNRKWWRVCTPQNFDLTVTNLNFAGWKRFVHRSLRASSDDSRNSHHIFRPDINVVIDDALQDATVIAKVDEGKMLTVFTTSGDPSAYRYLSPNIGAAKVSAEMCSHRRGADTCTGGNHYSAPCRDDKREYNVGARLDLETETCSAFDRRSRMTAESD
jgi:hypothetical protein